MLQSESNLVEVTGNKSIMLTQILPDIFEQEPKLKEALLLKVDKKKTGHIVSFLKENGLNSDKVYINEKSEKENKILVEEEEIKFGKYNNKNNSSFYDISFLKRVKPLDEKDNLIIIGFQDVK
jgi:precorrin-6B methylase 1